MGASVERLNRKVFAFQDLRRQVLAKADSLIVQFNSQKMREAYHAYLFQKLELAKKATDEFTKKKLGRYDILRIAGFVATEDNFSDAIASLLDPNRPHQPGTKPLRHALIKLRHRKEDTISKILEALDNDNIKIRVKRDLHLGITRPDVAIISNNFIILIIMRVLKITSDNFAEGADGAHLAEQYIHVPTARSVALVTRPE